MTDVKDDAGKAAEWNEKFCLTQVEQQVLSGKRLVLEAFDKDVGGEDSLGKIKPMSFVTLVEDEEEHVHTVKIYDTNSKEAGTLIVATQFIYVAPDPEPNMDLNRNCTLSILIKDAKFFKDADTFGKQDPFCRFKYDDEYIQTKVVDDGGKEATFNETFVLKNVFQEIRQDEVFELEALDKDAASADLLGSANPMTYNSLCQDDETHDMALELYDKNYKMIGSCNI